MNSLKIRTFLQLITFSLFVNMFVIYFCVIFWTQTYSNTLSSWVKIWHFNVSTGKNTLYLARRTQPFGEKQAGGTSADCGAGWERGHQGKVGRGWQERQKTQEWPRQSERGGGAVGGLWISFSVWHLPMCVMHTSVFTSYARRSDWVFVWHEETGWLST